MSKMLLNKTELQIMHEFANDYSKKVYGRAIAKKLNLNQKTVANILNKLEKEDILKFTREGKNKYYFLNSFNPAIKEIIKIIEIDKKISFLKKHKKMHGLFKKLEERSEGILIIFGSYAENRENKGSDLDVFVCGTIKEVHDLEEVHNLKINIVKSKNIGQEKSFFIEIMKKHIILKGLEKFIDEVRW